MQINVQVQNQTYHWKENQTNQDLRIHIEMKLEYNLVGLAILQHPQQDIF